MVDTTEGFVGLAEAAREAKRSEYTIRKWLREGKLTRYKRGQTTFIDINELRPQPVAGPDRRTVQK